MIGPRTGIRVQSGVRLYILLGRRAQLLQELNTSAQMSNLCKVVIENDSNIIPQ